MKGFTLVELQLSIAVVAIILAGLIPIVYATVDSASLDSLRVKLVDQNQLALTQFERDVRYSTAFDTTVTTPFSDPNAPSGGWKIDGTSASQRVLILESPATAKNPYSFNRSPVYTDSASYNCSTTPLTGTLYLNPPLTFTTVYFVQNGTLYKRILTDTTTPTCGSYSTQYQKQSCPTGSGGTCAAKDEVAATGVTKFAIDYWTQTDDPSPTFNLMDVYGVSAADTPDEADMLSITLESSAARGSTTISVPLSINVSRIN